MRVAATYLCLTQELGVEFSGKVFRLAGSFYRAGRFTFYSMISRTCAYRALRKGCHFMGATELFLLPGYGSAHGDFFLLLSAQKGNRGEEVFILMDLIAGDDFGDRVGVASM
jgi:hypothetical protein